MNKFFKLSLLFTFIVAIGLFYRNRLNKARINVSDCPNNRYMANRKEYYEKNYKIFKERKIKLCLWNSWEKMVLYKKKVIWNSIWNW